MMKPWLTINDLYYKDSKTGFILQIPELICSTPLCILTGPNGCGKSTLLHLIAKTIPLQKGSISYAKSIKHIHTIDQQLQTIGHLTVEEYCNLGAYFNQSTTTYLQQQQRLTSYLDSLELSTHRKHFMYQLSRGQQQRAVVANCLCASPDLILADEPVSAQDNIGCDLIYNVIQNYCDQNEATCVSIEHNTTVFKYATSIHPLFDQQTTPSNNYVFSTY